MQWLVILAGAGVVLAIIALLLAIIGLHRKPEQAQVSEQPSAIIVSSRDNLLRRLISSASTADINEAAFGVINTLLADPNLKFNYVSLMIWVETRSKMTLLGTNVAQAYGKDLVDHINELQNYVYTRKVDAVTNYSKDGTLTYLSAKERGICFEYYLPLYHGEDLIGAIYLESSDRGCPDVVTLEFFALMLDNISLVLNNIVLMQQVLRQANVDKLTQLYNRTYMMRYYEQLRAAHAEYSLILMDIDFFKKCNDTYGHNVGDIVLSEVAKVLSKSARSYQDGVFRYGGEEFLIILREAPLSVLKSRAEKIRQMVEDLTIVYEEGKSLKVTISVGIYAADIEKPLEKNIACADQALYYSKQHGRNRVTAYSEVPKDELTVG